MFRTQTTSLGIDLTEIRKETGNQKNYVVHGTLGPCKNQEQIPSNFGFSNRIRHKYAQNYYYIFFCGGLVYATITEKYYSFSIYL